MVFLQEGLRVASRAYKSRHREQQCFRFQRLLSSSDNNFLSGRENAIKLPDFSCGIKKERDRRDQARER